TRRRRFISDASHELRTPVAGLRARIELALAAPDEGEPGETLRRSLHDIDRLHQVIDDLFVLARLDNGDAFGREALDLGALIETELGRRDAAVRTAVKVERGLRVEVNPQGLCRVLLNLLADAERHARTRVEVEVSADGDEAVVEVRDDGPGVPPAERERIFELFARLDSARSRADGGSGLGLPVARRIAIAHDGRLHVADHPHGARFVLRLPLARDRWAPAQDRPAAVPPSPGAGTGPRRAARRHGTPAPRWPTMAPAMSPSSPGTAARELVVLGSTGSIGTQALDVVRRNPDRFRIAGLAAGGGRVDLLAAQALEFRPDVVAVARASAAQDLQLAFYAEAKRRGYASGDYPIPKIVAGPDAVAEVAAWQCDVVLNGVTGALGLASTLAALDAGRTLALANKESLIVGGPLVKERARPGQIVPVDSEHSALAQCLRGGRA